MDENLSCGLGIRQF